MNWRLAAVVAVFVVPLIWILAMGFGHDPHAVPSVLENRPAPGFSLRSLDGKAVSLEGLRGKPVLINFWASWCEPCKAEHQSLQAAAQAFGDKVQFLGVVYQDSPENAEAYLRQRGNVFPQLLDPDTRIAIDYGVAGVPESFFVDKDGMIRRKFVGALSFADIRQTFEPLLAARTTP
jgi:cytochrome c biogenesis protein CcmG/thiol:disulfide interchange protein DsbE